MNALKTRYKQEIVPRLHEQFKYDSVMAVPKIEKVVINMGVGEAVNNPKSLDSAVEELATISGQKPVVTKAKKSIAGFKLREGNPIGAKVTLRGERMYDFLEKLIHVSLPRVRDFRGVSNKAFDGRGNYTLGVKEQLIFPEIEYDKVDKVRGMDIVIVTTADSDEESRALLTEVECHSKNNERYSSKHEGGKDSWQKNQWLPNNNVLKSIKFVNIHVVNVVDGHTPSFVNSSFAGFVSESLHTKARFLV